MTEEKMKYIKGHLQNNLSKWTNKQWYHQRFDGSPYFMHFIAEAEIARHEERKKGGDFSVHFCFYDEGKADWYILMDDIRRVTDAIIKASKKNTKIGKTFIKTWEKDGKIFYKECEKVGKTNLAKLSNEKLIALHDEFVEITLNKNSSSSLIDGFALGTDEMIAGKIKEAYEKSELNGKMRFTEVFSTLTAPMHLSFINDAEIELLKIALRVEKSPKKELFIKENTQKIKKEIRGTALGKLIALHQKKYFWTRNNYVTDNVLTEEYFIEEIKKVLSIGVDLEKEIKRVQSTPKESAKKKKEILKKIKLDKELLTMIEISEDFTYWQDERKKSTFWTTHYFSLILAEIAKRTGRNIENLKYMSCREMSTIFNSAPSEEELALRKKSGVYYWDKKGMEAVHSREAEKVRDAVLGKTDFSDVDDFRGLTASLGKAVGRVKIVKSATELNKVENGDVLVAVMTRPDYVPAMKKASAIVTDEGGITCHAAIVSRELGIPCIIGTKIATKVLKDGEVAEVNANHGWVKRIKNQ
jgi:phosphohistidine swiveling domain-containing protein